MNALTRSSLRQLPLVPVRDVVVFPQTELVLSFGRRDSILAVSAALSRGDKLLAIFAQKDPEADAPGLDDLYRVGTLCVVERTLKSDGELNVLIRGLNRLFLRRLVSRTPYPVAESLELKESVTYDDKLEAMVRHLTSSFKEAVNLGKPVEFMNFMRLMSGVGAGELADQVANSLSLPLSDKQHLLELTDVNTRISKVIEHLARELKVLELEKSIATKTQAKFSKNMKEAVLRERLALIRKELGEEEDDDELELKELAAELKKLTLPSGTREQINKELKRYSRLSIHNPESSYLRTWLDTVIELPWGKYSPDRVALTTAQKVLDQDHYGLSEVKDRILEYLAVMKLKTKKLSSTSALPTILCFVGPPGVGKTSLGRSIARALKRRFVKVSLGGVRDEAEIRGHRRTYVGAMPGRIIAGIKQAGTSNPVFMLDELDKLGTDYHGDPSAALLEALDPEQNHSFEDHYLDLPYDLSRVMFITTANVLDTIPPALRDRLEVVRFPGYTETEKHHIARSHLLAKVRDKNALAPSFLRLDKTTLLTIIRSYTREAGVRSLERELGKLARKQARALAHGKRTLPKITARNLADYLGPSRYLPTLRETSHPVGMATGLAWTSSGGEILFIEVSLMPGKGRLKLTGQLGEVMKESAQAALTYVRAHWQELGLKRNFYESIDLHIHVPEGAVPKDGPSAGVTLTTALVSALTKKRVKKTIGMTGEITLRGRVLEIGGLKEKSIAAYTAGLKEIIIPRDNARDLVKIPSEIKQRLVFHPVASIDEVLSFALV